MIVALGGRTRLIELCDGRQCRIVAIMMAIALDLSVYLAIRIQC